MVGSATVSNGVHTTVRTAALLATVLLAALLLAAAVLRLPPIERWVTAQVVAQLQAGMSIEHATLTVLPPGVHLTNLALAPEGPTLESVSCRVRVPALVAGRVEIDSIAVDGAALTIERTAAGLVQVAGALAPLLGATSSGAPPAAATALFALPQITASEGSVTFIDRAARGGPRTLRLTDARLTLDGAASGPRPLTLAARFEPAGEISGRGTVQTIAAADGSAAQRAIDATVTATGLDAETVLSYLAAVVPGGGAAAAQGGLDGSLTVSGTLANLTGDTTLALQSGSVVWQDVSLTAPLTLSAHFATAGDGIALSDGRISIAQIAAGHIGVSDLTTAFDYVDGTVRLVSGSARAYGGSSVHHGTVTLADPPQFDLTLQADGLGCAALIAAVTGERPNYGCERLNAEVVARGAWTGAATAARGAEGSGHLELRGGTIPSSSVIGALWQAFMPFLHTSEAPRALTTPTTVDHLAQSFTLRSGRMETTNLSLVTDDYTLAGSGSIGLDGTLDLDAEVALTPAGVTKLLIMASLPIPGEPRPLPAIPTRITGTVGDPDVRPEIEHLGVAAGNVLWRGARGAGQALKDAAGSGFRALEHGLE